MKRNLKKFVSMFLALTLILSVAAIAPISVGAAETNSESVGATYTSGDFEYEVLYGGTAEITDYSGSATKLEIPSILNGYTVTKIGDWAFEDCTNFTNITIPDSVTSIGDYAFDGCISLTSTKIPDSVIYIGSMAFHNCTSLISITIPNSVTGISGSTFWECTSLTDVTIPDTVTFIEEFVFADCTSLESIKIPDSVTSISYGAFCDCTNLESIEVSENNSEYLSVDGVLYNKDKTQILAYPAGKTEKNYIIPDSVTSVYESAFKGCKNLERITIPDSVTSIGGNAFNDCTSLASITIHNNITSVGESAFYDTAWYDNQPDGVVYAGKVAYKYKGEMPENTSIVLKEGTTEITYGAFYNYPNLTSIVIPNSVTSIGPLAFERCKGLVSITIPDSVTSIDYYAFYDCTNLESVTISDATSISISSAFENCNIKEIIISDGSKEINSEIIEYAQNTVEKITIPDSVTSIESGSLDDTAWYDNQSDGVVYAGKVAYKYKGEMSENTSIMLKYGTKGISGQAFYGCKNLVSITIPDSVRKIGDSAFSDCTSLTEINVDLNNMNYASVNGVLYNKDKSKLITYTQGKTESSFSVPDSVTVIGGWAFSGCTSLTSITMPDSVTSISKYAFDGCENITDVYYCGSMDSWEEIEIEDENDDLIHNTTIHFIVDDDPEWWSNISWDIDNEGTLTISGIGVINPDGYSIEEDIPWCSEHESIKNVVIEDGITGIGNYAFMECSNLKTVSIPASVSDIGDFVFTYDMNSVKSINVDENNENYKSVDGVLFNKDMTEIIKYPNGRSGSYTIPETVTTIHTCAFRECTELTELEIPDSVTTFESYSFYNCDSLLSVTIPSSVTEMGSSYTSCGLGYKFHKGVDEPIENFAIKGYRNTEAESYANENNFIFIDLDNVSSGDTNGDGEINAKDRMMLTRYLAKWSGYESVDMTAADVNNDGDVNAKDRMILTRHLAKWQGYETLPFDKI